MEVRNGKLGTMGSLLAGGLIGAGLAIIFAPQSGRRTRREIRHLGKKMLNKSEAIGIDLRNSIDNLVDDISERLHDGVEVSRDWTKRTKKDVQNVVESGRAYLQEGVQKVRRVS